MYACAAPPPPYILPPPPPDIFSEHWQVATVADQADPFKSRISALFKRITSARIIDPALRSSSHLLACPGDDDCSHKCARACAEQHLSSLRAFAVTGESYQRLHPPSPHPPEPSPPPPGPPSVPFTGCSNTCGLGPDLAGTCRDGGYNSQMPALCGFGTQCSVCGFRANVAEADQDDSCETANNGACEDGGIGTLHYVDEDGREAYRCKFATDKTDCTDLGPRTITSKTPASFAGLTNATSPTPPPPLPRPPSPLSPPPYDLGSFKGCRDFKADAEVCYAFFDVDTKDLRCSGTKEQLRLKFEANVCEGDYYYYVDPANGATDRCSDGGYDSVVVKQRDVTYETSTFACDHGHQCIYNDISHLTSSGACPRVRSSKPFVDCEDECGIGTSNAAAVDGTGDAEPDTDAEGNIITTGTVNRVWCRDGGVDSRSAHCNYGTMVHTKHSTNLPPCARTLLTPLPSSSCSLAVPPLRPAPYSLLL